MALHLPIGPLKTHSGLDSVPRCEPSTSQLADDIATEPSGPVGINSRNVSLIAIIYSFI